MADEYLRLRNEVIGTDQVSRLVAEMVKLQAAEYAVATAADDTKDKEYALAQSFTVTAAATDKATIAASAHAAALRVAGREQDGFNRFLQDAAAHERTAQAVQTTAVQTHARYATAVSASAAGTNRFQQNITGLSYSMNDFFGVSGDMSQRLNAIANNLPMLLSGFGNLGLILSGVVPIIAMVVRNWDSLKEAFGLSVDTMKSRVDELKAKVKELEDRPVKLAVDTLELENAKKELDRLTKAYDAFREFQGLTTKDQREAGSKAKEILADVPGGSDALTRKLEAEMVRDQTARNDRLRDARAEQEKAAADVAKGQENLRHPRGRNLALVASQLEEDEAALKAAKDKAQAITLAIDEAAKAYVGEAFKGATEGRAEGRGRLVDLLERAGDKRTAQKLGTATPENVATDREDKAAVAERKKQQEAQEREQKEAIRRTVAQMNAFEQDADQAATAQTQMEHAAETERAKTERAAVRDEKADARAAKAAPRAAAAARRGAIEQGIEGEGFSPDQAAELTPKVQHLMNQNVPFPQALAQIVQQMDRALMMQQAKDEAAMGFMSDATRRFLMVEQHNAQVAQQMRGLAAGNRKGGGGIMPGQMQPFSIR